MEVRTKTTAYDPHEVENSEMPEGERVDPRGTVLVSVTNPQPSEDADRDGEPEDMRVMRIDPAPRYLKITDQESNFIKKLDALVATPRGAKRLKNTYRLVKATMTPADLVRLENKDHRAVLLMLAMQSSHPDEATEVFRALGSRRWGSWWAFVEQWEPKARKGKPGRYHNQLVGNIGEATAARWRELHRAMKLQKHNAEDDDIEAYIRLWPSVARFGFRTGRAVTKSNQ